MNKEDLSEEETKRIERVNQAIKERLDAEANLESQKKWRIVFERAPKETIPFIIYVVYMGVLALVVLFRLLEFTDVRLWIGALLLFVIMVGPLSVLPHKSWKKFSRYLKSKLTGGEKMAKPKFEVYKDKAGEWRWRLIAANGRIIADSGQGYINKQDCEYGIDLVKKEAPDADIEEEE